MRLFFYVGESVCCWTMFSSPLFNRSIKSRISSTRHAVVFGPRLTDLGNRPDWTPLHQLDRPMGISGAIGGLALRSPIICGKRRNPMSGNLCVMVSLHILEYKASLARPVAQLDDVKGTNIYVPFMSIN